MTLRDIWYTAEQIALKFTLKPQVQKFGEVTIKIAHTIVLLVLCICVFIYLGFTALFKMLQDKFKTNEIEDQVTEISEDDYKPKKAELDEPEFVKRLRKNGI